MSLPTGLRWRVPDYLPETDEVRQDLAEFYGSITVADAAVGQLLDALASTGLDRTTWVVFMTDHGPALPRAKSTLYDAGTGIAVIVRPPLRQRPSAACLRRPVQRRGPGSDTARAAGGGRACRCRWASPMHLHLRAASRSGTPGTVRGVHDQDVSRFLRPDPGDPDEGIQLYRELRVPAPARPAVGHRRQRIRVSRLRHPSVARGRSANCTTSSMTRPNHEICSARTQQTKRRRSPMSSPCC